MKLTLDILTDEMVLQRLHQARGKVTSYRAFYSSWLGGITTNPALMLVPVDDHMVHRGDGVFEAFKSKNKKVWLLEEHLNRLEKSAERLHLKMPMSRAEMKQVILETLRVSGLSESLVRLYLSRGPGGFTTNPYESVGSQLYIAVTDFSPLRAEKYQQGVRIGLSEVQIKEGLWAQVKSCNYLPNVMMKKEALDRNLDFVIGVDGDEYLTESSTENIAYLNKAGAFCYPHFDNTLRGTSLLRLAELLRAQNKEVREVQTRKDDLVHAKAIFMVGTTLDVLPVVEFEGQQYKSVEAAAPFASLFEADQASGDRLTEY
jgi:branched-chain amino acid aminotransferase